MTRELAGRVADRFGLGAGGRFTSVSARGEQGRVRQLRTVDGLFSVKQAFDEPDVARIEQTAAFQLRCHEAGVSCPRPVVDVTGRFLVDVDGAWISVQTWVELADPDPALDPGHVGLALAALHQVVISDDSTTDPWDTEPVGPAEWRTLVRTVRTAEAPFAERLAALAPQLLVVEELLTPMAATQWCHLDLFPDNLRGSSAGPRGSPVWAIDFDQAGPADPSRELAMVAFAFARSDRARLRTLLDAYADAGGPGRLRGVEDFGLIVAQLHHIARYQVLAWLTADTPGARARAEANVAEFVDEPLLLADVERLVAWATR